MKTMLKIFSVLAVLAMIVSLIPMTVLAETPVTATIKATVAVKGKQPSPAETYTIRLTAEENDFPMPDGKTGGSADLKITGAGSGSFPAISYDRIGVYTYTIKQIAGTSANAKYDSTVYDLKVTVYWEDGALAISVALREEGKDKKLDTCTFEVEYTAKTTPTPTPTPTSKPEPTPTPKRGGGGGTPLTPDDDLGMGGYINIGECIE